MKYILVIGNQRSKIDKGILSSCIGVILQSYGLSTTYLKLEPGLDFNLGKMQPSIHGEIYILKDGSEVNLSLGIFERFCAVYLTKDNFLSNGKILHYLISEKKRRKESIAKEIVLSNSYRKYIADYVSELSKSMICTIKNEEIIMEKPDVMIIEVGSSSNYDEYSMCLSGISSFVNQLDEADRCVIAVSDFANDLGAVYKEFGPNVVINAPESSMMNIDITIFRDPNKTAEPYVREIKLEENYCFMVKNSDFMFEMPCYYHESGIYKAIKKKLLLNSDIVAFSVENKFKVLCTKYPTKRRVGILTRHKKDDEAYVSLLSCITTAGKHQECDIEAVMIDIVSLYKKEAHTCLLLKEMDGIIIPGGFGDCYIDTRIEVAQYARVHNVPCLGICLGFQIQLIEFARNVLNMKDATSKEFTEDYKTFIITKISDFDKKLKDGTMFSGESTIELKGVMESKIYRTKSILGKFRHSYCMDSSYIHSMAKEGMSFLGMSENYKTAICMIEAHKFYVGVQHHPELSSRPEKADPIISSFIEAVKKQIHL